MILKDLGLDTVSLVLFKKGYYDTCLQITVLPQITNTISIPLVSCPQEIVKNQNRFIFNRKKRKIGIILSYSSIAAFAGAGILTYYANKENNEALEIKETLDNSVIFNSDFEELQNLNREKAESAELKYLISAGILGIGCAGLGTGLVFYFPSKKYMFTAGLRGKQ